MSQFKVERVTKVKGLTDLSEKAKVSDKAELTAKRNRGTTTSNERPGSSNAKPTSLKKSASPSKSVTSEAPGSKSTGRTLISHRTSPPKPAARSKPATATAAATKVFCPSNLPLPAANSPTPNAIPMGKNCPASQQGKQTSSSAPDVPAGKKKPASQGVTPVPHSRTAALAKPSSQKTVKEPNTKKKNELKKESSYDASDSDSEQGSVDRLNTDGDFGYETGSLDDSDVSTGELLSPSAKDEQKTILTPKRSESTGYSYAEVEFRPLMVTDDGGISTKHPEPQGLDVQTGLSVDTDTSSDCRSYTYAGDEFRPLIVTEGGGVVAPVEARKSSKDPKDTSDGKGSRPMPMAYEEVTIVDGSFDRSNIKVIPASEKITAAESETLHSVIGPKNDVYAVVQKKPKETNPKDPDCSAPLRQDSPMQRPIVELGDVVPAIPGGRKDSSMYEAITGELQSMIMACDDVELEGKSSRTNSDERKTSAGERRLPPPIPKPYSGPGLSAPGSEKTLTEEASEHKEKVLDKKNTEDTSQPVYAVVQKKSKDKPDKERSSEDVTCQTTPEKQAQNSQPVYAEIQKIPKPEQSSSVESLDQLRILPTSDDDDDDDNSDEELPPPLPSRLPNLEDTMKRTEPSENVFQFDKKEQPEEKSKKGGGFKIFKKKHRRQLSDGNVVDKLKNGSEKFGLSPSAGEKFQHRRSKSQADVMKIVEDGGGPLRPSNTKITYVEVEIPSNNASESSDEKPPIKPYMEVDITEPPLTPTFMKKRKSMGGEIEDQNGPHELPEGWREVKGDTGTYYWHVASGTTQWTLPQVATRQKKLSEESKSPESTERQKVLSFPVHSMGWIELEEGQVAPHNMSETITDCISTLAQKRKDLWNTAETWGEGKDIRLLLEGDTLKLAEPRTKATLLVQPVSKMRVWGVGKEDQRDFAYVARDPATGKHKCHMFRCHGNISGRAITNALHDMCSKILEEKKKAQESSRKTSAQKPWSDIINTPPPSSARDNASFNEKPHVEPKKSFSAKYVGSIDVPKPTGVETLNKAINKLTSRGDTWRTILIEISVSNIRITDCTTQELISEDRVRFMSFFGVGNKDERLCGYIVSTAPEVFVCHVFQCAPNAAALTKALAEACQLRFQKCVDAHPEIMQKVAATEQEKMREKSDKDKDKAGFMTSVQGFLGKLGPKKGGGKKEESSAQESKPSSNIPVITCKPSHTFMVKYYGALPVAVGTGIETVEEAAKHLAGGTLLVCQLDVALNGVTLYDSQRSALSKRNLDADTISYCGLTSNRSHFGLIQSMGGGKYICHVFAEYKTKAGPIVAAIHETL